MIHDLQFAYQDQPKRVQTTARYGHAYAVGTQSISAHVILSGCATAGEDSILVRQKTG